jgi:thiosulfate/3-mercaptopyruvate sulfurtransferase
MKKLIAILALAACLAPAAFARDIEPVVSAAWLEANLANPNLVVMDVRAMDAYKAGHIPGAVSVIGASLYVKKGDINNEVPEMDDLSDTLSAAGVKAESWIVVVETDGSRLAWSTRVTWTLKYAGLENVAFLDGGYAAWTKAAKPVSKEVAAKTGSYSAKANPAVFADKAMVLAAKGAQIVDARTYDTYFGLVRQAFVAQAGHFPGAYALPYTWMLNADNTVKAKADLASYAAKLGLDPALETIVYCDSGVLATAWWYAFSEILGWKNVKSFDGSSQVLAADPSVKYVPLTWR